MLTNAEANAADARRRREAGAKPTPGRYRDPAVQRAYEEEYRNAYGEAYGEAFDKAEKEGRRAQRDRCETILYGEHAKGREAMANHLAFATDMTADQAVSLLSAAPQHVAAAAPRDRLDRYLDEDAPRAARERGRLIVMRARGKEE